MHGENPPGHLPTKPKATPVDDEDLSDNCPATDYGHDQHHDDPDTARCIHCGLLVTFVVGGNPEFVPSELIIQEEPF